MADQLEELLRATLIRGYDAGPTVDGRELLGSARAARRRRLGSVGAVMAVVVVAAAVTVPLILLRAGGSASPPGPASAASTQAPSTWHPFVPFAGMAGLPMLPDPRSGRAFDDAAQASAASAGAYVPDCPGHTNYYVRNGEVVTFFHGNDAEMGVAGPHSGSIFGPTPRSALVEPHVLRVHGQIAYGYRAIHDKPEALRVSGHVVHAVMYRSFLEWNQGGSIMTLSSQNELSLQQLTAIANSCH